MPTITGYTATRMLQIENETVTGGLIVGDNLILTRRDAVTIDAGNVRGPTGGSVPPGTLASTISATQPDGWLFHNQAVLNAQTLFSSLWAVAPASWKSGSTLNVPNLANVGIMQAGTTALGAQGGANTRTIAEANLPSHVHGLGSHNHSTTVGNVSADHSHGFTTGGQSVSHIHGMSSASGPNANGIMLTASGASSFALGNGGALQAHATWATPTMDGASADHSHSGSTGGISANHNHIVTVAAATGNTGATGSGTALTTTPAHLGVNIMIKT